MPRINYYRGEGDPVEHIPMHEASLIGKKNDDNHFVFLFPATLGSIAYHFFRFPKALVRS